MDSVFVDEFFEKQLLTEDTGPARIGAACEAAGLPPFSVTPTQGKFLQLLAQVSGARRILEVGTLGGYSTAWLAQALPVDGQLITLEIDPERARFARTHLPERVTIRVGSAMETLPQLVAEGSEPFDFVFIDADKQHTLDYFQWAVQLSRPGTVIVVDNVVRDGEILNRATEDKHVRGMQRFFAYAAKQTVVDMTGLQTVGAKGWDGFVLGRVR
jgi:predicted O-methyltransferase YrrM